MDYVGTVHCPEYTHEVFSPVRFPYLVERMVAKVKAILVQHPEIEALAACGNSGVPLLGAICAATGLAMIVVRKTLGEKGHDTSMVNGAVQARAYLFIDDLISSGRTLGHVRDEIEALNPEAKCVGALLYEESYTRNYPAWLGRRGEYDCAGWIWGSRASSLEIDWSTTRDQKLHDVLGGPNKGKAPVIPIRSSYSVEEMARFSEAARELAKNIEVRFKVLKARDPPGLPPGDLSVLIAPAGSKAQEPAFENGRWSWDG